MDDLSLTICTNTHAATPLRLFLPFILHGPALLQNLSPECLGCKFKQYHLLLHFLHSIQIGTYFCSLSNAELGLLWYLTDKILKELPLFYASAFSLVTMKPTRSPDLEEIQCVLTARAMASFSPLPSWMFYRWSLGLSETRDGKAAILEGKEKESVAEEWLVTEQLMGTFCMGCK